MTITELSQLYEQPAGAEFRLAALHVNPYSYSASQSKFEDEASYNKALVAAMVERNVTVVGVADHHDVASGRSLLKVLRAEGITAFPGFEAASSEGVHVICLFDPQSNLASIDRRIGELGVQPGDELQPGSLSFDDLMARVQEDWDAVAIAAHVTYGGGLLKVVTGQTRVRMWASDKLKAAAIPCAPKDVNEQDIRDILECRGEYKRQTPIALICASDVSKPEDLDKDGATTWLKMSGDSIGALRQAFLDPSSRVRRHDQALDEEHPTIDFVTWDGGFLDGEVLLLNSNLNCLIGGRGTGKSTVIESIRFALDVQPDGQAIRRDHLDLINGVLGPGAEVTLGITSTSPDSRRYLVRREVGRRPVVSDAEGDETELRPMDVLGSIELYSQHELIDLAQPEAARISLLRRCVEDWDGHEHRIRRAEEEVSESKSLALELLRQIEGLDEERAKLVAAQEKLRRYESAGLDEEVRTQGDFAREAQMFSEARSRLETAGTDVEEVLADVLPIDTAFLSDSVIANMPSNELLAKLRVYLDSISSSLGEISQTVNRQLAEAMDELSALQGEWEGKKKKADERYKKLLRKVGTDRASAQEFVELRQQVERLESVDRQRRSLSSRLRRVSKTRDELLDELDQRREERQAALQKAARKLTKATERLVRLKVVPNADYGEVESILERHLPGRTAELREAIRSQEGISARELAAAARQGSDAVLDSFPSLPERQARILAEAGDDTLMDLEVADVGPRLRLELRAEPGSKTYRDLSRLSTGQKATAMLILLLAQSTEPLLIDQPEDDLDNSFIATGIVPRLRATKFGRQFLFTTHNANIPVLGDAEAIAVMESQGSPSDEGGHASFVAHGSIDDPFVRAHVEDLLEGGREAFEQRRRKYGY